MPLPATGSYAAVAPRLQLDDALVRLARELGADIRDGHGFERLDEHDDHVTVVADGLEIDARYVVAADGMWSPVRKSIGANEAGYLGEWHGFRQYARNVTGPAAKQLHVWFEPDLVPGYAWSFPLPGRPGQHRLRRAARRQPSDPGHEAALGRAAGPSSHRRRARRRLRARGPPHRLADPGSRRRGHADHRSRAVHRRRRDGHRRDDRRGHRPGAADRSPRRRGDHRGRGAPARRCGAIYRPRSSTTCSPTIGCRGARVGARDVVGRAGAIRVVASSGTGADETSPAGCSRTSRGRWCSPPADGTAASSLSPAPAPARATETYWCRHQT